MVSSHGHRANGTLGESLLKPEKNQMPGKAAMVIAVYPFDWTRVSSLWSQLECFSTNVDTIIVASPRRGRPILDVVIETAKKAIPVLNGKSIQTSYFLNDRYDVGLWCDALLEKSPDFNASLLNEMDSPFDSFLLINDSLWAMEHSSELLDSLRQNRSLAMVSLNFNDCSEEFCASHGFWLESVMRAFSRTGVRKFLTQKCVPSDHAHYCVDEPRIARKNCIVQNFEKDVVNLFSPGTVCGLYPGTVPTRFFPDGKPVYEFGKSTWVGNLKFWQYLRKELKFPAAKSSHPDILEQIKILRPQDLQTCTKYINELIVMNLTFPRNKPKPGRPKPKKGLHVG